MARYKVCIREQGDEKANENFHVCLQGCPIDLFKKEIFIRKPELENQLLRFYYKDVDGDNITIWDQSDLSNCFTQSITQKQNVVTVFVLKIAPIQVNPTVSSAVSTESTPVLNRAHHANVYCGVCSTEIHGYRYKCLECNDFDLCMECEPTSHARHLMIRIADPAKTAGANEIIENWQKISKN